MALTGKDIEKINIYEYEEILMGHKLNFKVSFRSSPKNNRIELANVWRYAITVLLGWTPKDAEKYLTADIVHKYCLDKTFVAVDKNYEKKFHADYKSILQYVFPDEITYNQDEETINEYSRSAKINQYANEKKNYRFNYYFVIIVVIWLSNE